MSRKHRLAGIATAFIAVLALSAIAATSAFGAQWVVLGKSLAELSITEETLTATGASLALDVPGRNITVECKVVEGSGRIVQTTGGDATLELSECITMEYETTEPIENCNIVEPVIAKLKAELIEGEGAAAYVLLEGLESETIGVIQYKSEEGCVLPKNNPLRGDTAGELEPGESVEQELTFSQEISEATETQLTLGLFPADLKGSIKGKLSGANTGEDWGACLGECVAHPYDPQEGFGGENPAAPNLEQSCTGDPINCASGNFFLSQTDVSIAGRGPVLEVARSYNAQLAATQAKAGPFGYGWTGPYSAHLSFDEEAGTTTVHHDNGSAAVFYGEGLTGGPWVQATLAKEGESFIYTLPDQSKLKFNASGQLTEIADRHGNALALAYEEGRLATVEDDAERQLTFAYDEAGQVKSVEDPMGFVVKYTYESGHLATVTLPGKETARWKFKYDGSHRMTELTDGRGNTTKNEYDASHRVILQTEPLERKRKLEYKEAEGVKETLITEPNGSKTLKKFNGAGEPLSITRASGTELAQTTTYKYDASLNLVEVTDANNHTTTYGYDAEGNKTSEKDANGNETKWTYNSTRDVKTMTTPKGVTTTYVRNAAGDPETIERPAPGEAIQKTTFKWAKNGDLEEEADPLGRTTAFEYDSFGNRKAETNPAGDKQTWTYNEDSQLVSEVSPRGNEEGAEASEFETKYERDPQGRPLTATNPLGHTIKRAYDDNGNLETLTNGKGRTTTYTYDEADQLIEVKAPNGDLKETDYDSMGRVTSQTNGNEDTTEYKRNLLGQITEEIDPLARKATREYDAAGNLKKAKDAEGRTITYSYDAGDRLIKVDYSEEATADVVYEYDKNDNVTVMKDGTGTTEYGYDSLDRLTKVENGAEQVVEYEYNLGDEQTKVTYPNGKAISRAYDKAGRLEKVTDWLSGETKFAYDRDSQLKATTFPAGSTNVDEYAYNNADQLTKVTMKRGSETLASLSYVRDKAGQVESETQTGLPGAGETEFGYDENERLTNAGAVEFEYDPANSPTSIAGTSYSYDEASQLEKGGGVSFSFNKVGQRTKAAPESGPATSYGYDQAGNLISVTREEEGKVAKIEDTYTYDGSGLRASQSISGAEVNLAWDVSGELPLLLSDGANSYLYGPGGLPVAQISGESITYLHQDQLGSTRLLTNSSGEAKGAYTYSPYGAVSGQTGTATTPLGFNGQYRNESTGLIYLRARTYDPVTAQFLSVDPRLMETGEAYAYAGDNPVNAGDPSGESPILRPPSAPRPAPPPLRPSAPRPQHPPIIRISPLGPRGWSFFRAWGPWGGFNSYAFWNNGGVSWGFGGGGFGWGFGGFGWNLYYPPSPPGSPIIRISPLGPRGFFFYGAWGPWGGFNSYAFWANGGASAGFGGFGFPRGFGCGPFPGRIWSGWV